MDIIISLKKLLMNNLLYLLFIGCTIHSSLDTAIIKTPTTQCGMCKQTIESNLLTIKGVKSATVDMLNYQTVITYKTNRVNLEDLELAIAKSGYQANEVKADSTAYEKLHLCCRLPKDRK
jgi:copper chaperone CopZ